MKTDVLQQHNRFPVFDFSGFNHFEGMIEIEFQHFNIFLLMFNSAPIVHLHGLSHTQQQKNIKFRLLSPVTYKPRNTLRTSLSR